MTEIQILEGQKDVSSLEGTTFIKKKKNLTLNLIDFIFQVWQNYSVWSPVFAQKGPLSKKFMPGVTDKPF